MTRRDDPMRAEPDSDGRAPGAPVFSVADGAPPLPGPRRRRDRLDDRRTDDDRPRLAVVTGRRAGAFSVREGVAPLPGPRGASTGRVWDDLANDDAEDVA